VVFIKLRRSIQSLSILIGPGGHLRREHPSKSIASAQAILVYGPNCKRFP
jgi:hypothetical protein